MKRDREMLCLSVIEPRSFELRGSLFSVVTPPSARGGRPATLSARNCKSETELRFTSGKENKYNLYLDVHLLDNQGNKGPLLYSSDLITPGQVLLNDGFEVNLPAGTYRGLASINALDPETFGFVGKSQLNITIYIANTVE